MVGSERITNQCKPRGLREIFKMYCNSINKKSLYGSVSELRIPAIARHQRRAAPTVQAFFGLKKKEDDVDVTGFVFDPSMQVRACSCV